MIAQIGPILLKHRCLPTGKRISLRTAMRRTLVGLLSLAALAATAQNPMNPGGALRTDKVDDVTPLNQPPDANAQMLLRERQAKQWNFAVLNAERKRQIAEDSATLIKLAADFKAEIDKTGNDALSVTIVRKADEIEKLAHSVKEKMKLTIGTN